MAMRPTRLEERIMPTKTTRRDFLIRAFVSALSVSVGPPLAESTSGQPILPRIDCAYLDPVISRAKRICVITTRIVGGPRASDWKNIRVSLKLPKGVRTTSADGSQHVQMEESQRIDTWTVLATNPTTGTATVTVTQERKVVAEKQFTISFHTARAIEHTSYVPTPMPVSTGDYLIGAMLCPLWRQTALPGVWNDIAPFPDRTPVLGYYDEGDPEVSDWEIKFAVEHGINFFVPVWYRQKDNLGKPVRPLYEHWINGFLQSRYAHMSKFAILWENSNDVTCGVAGESDLISNLLNYWITRYFKSGHYLILDGKPLIYIYTIPKFIQEIGGEAAAARSIRRMREAAVDSGFRGLILLGCNNTASVEAVEQMNRIGLDHSYSYHWPTFTPLMPASESPSSSAVVEAQKQCWERLAKTAPENIITVSMGWDSTPWKSSSSGVCWRLTPVEFKELCRSAKAVMDQRSPSGLDHRMMLVDNWNEYGEGHYIFPTRQYAFGYLNAIRATFAVPSPAEVEDLTPEDVSLGPYDRLYRAVQTRRS